LKNQKGGLKSPPFFCPFGSKRAMIGDVIENDIMCGGGVPNQKAKTNFAFHNRIRWPIAPIYETE
jgi:hypothetical protein